MPPWVIFISDNPDLGIYRGSCIRCLHHHPIRIASRDAMVRCALNIIIVLSSFSRNLRISLVIVISTMIGVVSTTAMLAPLHIIYLSLRNDSSKTAVKTLSSTVLPNIRSFIEIGCGKHHHQHSMYLFSSNLISYHLQQVLERRLYHC